MKRCPIANARAALVLAALVLAGGPAAAQFSSPDPGTTSGPYHYPYWGEAPTSFHGESVPRVSGLTGGVGRTSSPPGHSLLPWSSTRPLFGHYTPANPAEAAALLPRDSEEEPGSAAYITLRVPAGAEVWFDGARTRQTGPVRQYSSPPLSPGRTYTYQVRVRWEEGGKAVEQTRRIKVQANARVDLDLTRPPAQDQ
jgi:uncharacterized protein (TIGR03000 family)